MKKLVAVLFLTMVLAGNVMANVPFEPFFGTGSGTGPRW